MKCCLIMDYSTLIWNYKYFAIEFTMLPLLYHGITTFYHGRIYSIL